MKNIFYWLLLIMPLCATTLAASTLAASTLEPIYAGTLYPKRGVLLENYLRRTFDAVQGEQPRLQAPIRVVIAPHEEYVHLGYLLAKTYAGIPEAIDRVIILGAPQPRAPVSGLWIPQGERFRTPMGEIALDLHALRTLSASPLVRVMENPAQELGSIELQLPFLQYKINTPWKLVPLISGALSAGQAVEAARLLQPLLGERTLLVVATNLTRYGKHAGYVPFPIAGHMEQRLQRHDQQIIDRVAAADLPGLLHLLGDGNPISNRGGLTLLAALMGGGSRIDFVDYQVSGERIGDYSLSVSYLGAVVSSRQPLFASALPIPPTPSTTVATPAPAQTGIAALPAPAPPPSSAAATGIPAEPPAQHEEPEVARIWLPEVVSDSALVRMGREEPKREQRSVAQRPQPPTASASQPSIAVPFPAQQRVAAVQPPPRVEPSRPSQAAAVAATTQPERVTPPLPPPLPPPPSRPPPQVASPAPAQPPAAAPPPATVARPALNYSTQELEILHRLAVVGIRTFLEKGRVEPLDLNPYLVDMPASLKANGAVFVTLRQGGEMRGSIGFLEARFPLFMATTENAIAAATRDQRFSPLRSEELSTITLEVSIISPQIVIENPNDIVLGKDGITLTVEGRSAAFLPDIPAKYGWDIATTLAQLARQLGLAPEGWQQGRLAVFRTQSYEAPLHGSGM